MRISNDSWTIYANDLHLERLFVFALMDAMLWLSKLVALPLSPVCCLVRAQRQCPVKH